jgi:hypothetical protein
MPLDIFQKMRNSVSNHLVLLHRTTGNTDSTDHTAAAPYWHAASKDDERSMVRRLQPKERATRLASRSEIASPGFEGASRVRFPHRNFDSAKNGALHSEEAEQFSRVIDDSEADWYADRGGVRQCCLDGCLRILSC